MTHFELNLQLWFGDANDYSDGHRHRRNKGIGRAKKERQKKTEEKTKELKDKDPWGSGF